ncbi:PilW family protein [Paraferrimonas haliotis]|uniref:MSHA biogenesis protein MshO n=1 Tax=Paraferrimonas haliotis TaxID=2013866 RepID=A0AA37TPY5_9GAMM|nr:type II secretion system protein [Paraferrimonas haliotis]GLS82351.1 MSHA biogenesis protein MshO [Paraferrimonas haliotis]
MAKHGGFTLVELITVVILLGILSVGVTSFITYGSRIFADSTATDQIISQSRFAIERMTREIRSALPNSVRTDSGSDYQCIEFIPIQASASYIDIPTFPETARNSATVFNPTPNVSGSGFTMLVYPLQPSDAYVDNSQSIAKAFAVNSVSPGPSDDTKVVRFQRTVLFLESSPSKRFYLVTGAVSYCFEGDGRLRRYSGYRWDNALQPGPSLMGTGVLMSEGIVNDLNDDPPIELTPSTLVNNAMVHLQPEYQLGSASLRYQHQVQVINVP